MTGAGPRRAVPSLAGAPAPPRAAARRPRPGPPLRSLPRPPRRGAVAGAGIRDAAAAVPQLPSPPRPGPARACSRLPAGGGGGGCGRARGGLGRPQPQARRAPPPAECMRLTLLCCTWREERMGEEGARDAGRRGADLGAAAGTLRCWGETEKQGAGRGGGRACPPREAGPAARPRPLCRPDELVLQKPAGPSLESSHPVFPSSAPVRCSSTPPLAAGPLLPFIPAFSHPPTADHPGGSPGTAHSSPGLHPCVLCPSQARPGPPLIMSLTGPWKKESLGKLQPWVRIAAPVWAGSLTLSQALPSGPQFPCLYSWPRIVGVPGNLRAGWAEQRYESA